ncbi:MAG: hypothetical protein HYS81_03465 [Candidatus Aenigmatarchaeota archaeon]|nr:MAG: hypothetical protein HYS81_03465 [Candidatus Aenigmarchaeota archaeon]
MRSKGVAPILATVLIVLVVIALAGAFLVWSNRAFSAATESGTAGTQRVTGATSEQIKIEALTCGTTDNITIRNLGTAIDTADLTLFVNNTLTSVTWTPAGSRAQYSLTHISAPANVFYSGNTIKVVAKQGATDSTICS